MAGWMVVTALCLVEGKDSVKAAWMVASLVSALVAKTVVYLAVQLVETKVAYLVA